MNISYIGRRNKIAKPRKIMVDGYKAPEPRTEGFGPTLGIEWLKLRTIPGTDLDTLVVAFGHDCGWDDLVSNWGEETRAGDLIEDGIGFGMDSPETYRGFKARKLARCHNGQTYCQAAPKLTKQLQEEDLHREMEIRDCNEYWESGTGKGNPPNEELHNLLAEPVGPYEATVDIHLDTFEDLVNAGVETAWAFELAQQVNEALRNQEVCFPGLERSNWLRNSVAFADDETDLSFFPVVEDEPTQIDNLEKGTRWDLEGDDHRKAMRKIRRAEAAPLDTKGRVWGWLDGLGHSREGRFRWLEQYFLSCRSKAEVQQARSRLIEAISLNNGLCRKMEAMGHKEAWVAAILAPAHKSKLMGLARELLSGQRQLGCWARPPRHTQPWMPRPLNLEEVAKLLHPTPAKTFPNPRPTKRVPRNDNISEE